MGGAGHVTGTGGKGVITGQMEEGGGLLVDCGWKEGQKLIVTDSSLS